MQPPFPSVTATWHNDTYSAISPNRPELSAKGKTVIVIGAGSGIGRATAVAFAQAGAEKLLLVGRTLSSLTETSKLLQCPTTTHVADITKGEDVQGILAGLNQWDVLVIAAGEVAPPASIVDTPADDWWQTFETNVKGNMNVLKALLPHANPNHATVLGLTSSAAALPVAMLPGLSAYMSSKLAQIKLFEFVAAENPNVFAATVHPGMIETAMFKKSGSNAEKLPMDTVELPAHFMLWLSTPEAAFLNGRSVWANWDVDELKAQARDIQSGLKLTSGINGWPF